MRDLLGVQGVTTKMPLVYLVRENLRPLAQVDDARSNFPDFDSQLVARTPILTAAASGGAVTDEELENQGPSAKRPEVNVDNAAVYI